MNEDYSKMAYEAAVRERKQAQEEAMRDRWERDAARRSRDAALSGRAALDYEVGRLQRLLAEALRERDDARRALVATEATKQELRCQLADARAIVQEVYEANDYQGLSFETHERLRRGELPWLHATMEEPR